MNTSIKKIFINAGGLTGSTNIHSFFTRNIYVLQKVGIYYAVDNANPTLHEQDALHFIIKIARISEDALKENINTFILQIANVSSIQQQHTLVLSSPNLFRHPDDLSNLLSALQQAFSNAQIHVFTSYAPQYLETQMFLSYVGFFISVAYENFLTFCTNPQNSLFLYDQLWEKITTFADKAVFHPYIMQPDDIDGSQALWAFLKCMNLSRDFLQNAGADFTPPSYILSQLDFDFIELSRYMTALHNDNKDMQGVVPWSTQAPYFMPEKSSSRISSSLLDPALQKSIYEQYKESNKRFAALLDIDKELFCPPPDIPPWEKPQETTPQRALKCVEKLDAHICDIFINAVQTAEKFYSYAQYTWRDAFFEKLQLRAIPKVSVFTLTYNQEAYIAECIESVLAQKTNFPVEHLIAVDLSEDNTADIVEQYAIQYPTIRPIYFKHRSGGKSVSELFGFCKSPYVALCDGDDYFTDPSKLQKQVDFLEAHPDYGLCFHPVHVVYEDGTNRERFYPPLDTLPRGVREFYYLADLVKCNLIQTNSVMYRWLFRDGLPEWFRSDLVPGDWYWHLLHAEKGKIGFINEVMAVYRRHKASLYYTTENFDTLIQHRLLHGMKELEMYDVVNTHFERKYDRAFCGLANNVFSAFLEHQFNTDDGSYLKDAMEKYPVFGGVFLKEFKMLKTQIIAKSGVRTSN